jgi:serpin B
MRVCARLTGELARRREGDVCFSPVEAVLVPAVLEEGADDATAAALRRAVGVEELSLSAYRGQALSLRALAERKGRRVSVQMNLAMWVDGRFEAHAAVRRLVSREFRTRVTGLDFRTSEARPSVERSLAEFTGSELRHLSEPLPADSSIVAVAAMVTRGPWYEPFDAANTADAPFTRGDGTRRTVRLMHQHTVARCGDADGVTRVDLPLGQGERQGERNSELEFTVLLPAASDGLGVVIDRFSAGPDLSWIPSGKFNKLDLALPRLQIADALRLDTLLGIEGVPLDGVADQPLHLSAVWHAAPLRLNEQGISQADRTTTKVIANSLAEPPQRQVIADRPFLFVLHHADSDLPLLVGLVR